MTSLSLNLVEVDAKVPGKCLSFILTMLNSTSARLLLPYPEITDLRFTCSSTKRESEWFTDTLASTTGSALLLDVGESKSFDLDAHFEDSICSDTDDATYDYGRWCTDISPGKYTATYLFSVDENYFNPDSHWRFQHLAREAKEHSATAWVGAIKSNVLNVERMPI